MRLYTHFWITQAPSTIKKFFSLLSFGLTTLSLVAQDQEKFEIGVKQIDSLISVRNFELAKLALIDLKTSLTDTSLLSQDSISLYFTSNFALVYYQLGNCEEMIKYSQEDLSLKGSVYGVGNPIALSASRNLGIYYLNCDSTERAKSVLKETLDLHKEHIGEPDEIYVRTLDDLAFTLGKLGEIEEAQQAYVELLALLDSKNAFYYHVVENYSAFLMSNENYDAAARYYLDIKKHKSESPEYPFFLKDYYNVFVNIKDYVMALDASSLIISNCSNNEICTEEGIDTKQFILNSARLSMLLSQNEEASQFYQDAESSFKEDKYNYVSILLEQFSLYDQLGNRDMQLSKLNLAIDFQRTNGMTDSVSYTRTVTNLGTLYTETGKFKLADELFLNYIDDLESKGSNVDPLQLANAYQSLGNQRYFLQNFKDADLYLVKAKDILVQKDLTNTNEYASILNSLGALCEGLASYKKAENNYRLALSVVSEASTPLRISLASNLANILSNTDPENDSIDILLDQAIAWQLESTGEAHPTYANMLGNRGAYYHKTERFQKAEQDLNLSINILSRTVSEDHPHFLSTLTNLSLLYEQTNREEEALESVLKAKGLYEKYYSSTHPGYILTLNNLSNLYTKMERYEEAETLLMELATIQVQEIHDSFSYLSEAEKKSFVQEKQKLLNNFKGYIVARTVNNEGSIKPEVITKWYDLELSTKGMLLNSTKKIRNEIFNSQDAELIGLFSDWTSTRKQIADMQSLKNNKKTANQSSLESLIKKANDLEKKISRRSTVFTGAFVHDIPTFSHISESLSTTEASVEIIRTQIGDDTLYVALIGISGNTSPEIFVIGKGENLEKGAFKTYKNKIAYKMDDVDSFESYWRKISDYLTTNGITKIYYAPDGVYHKISLVTLFNPDTKEYLLDNLEIVQVTSTKNLISLKEEVSTTILEFDNVLLVGRPSYTLGSGSQDLPGTEAEVNEIREVLEKNGITSHIKLRDDASEKEIKALLNSNLVHIATHGFFNDKSKNGGEFFDPMMNAGLLLADVGNARDDEEEDGILTAYEIMNLELSNVEMIVLSACETALGEISSGEGIYGLQRAFFVGGAKNLIMSLWKVDDQATKELMTTFYKEYLKKGDKRAAFISTQQKIKKKYKSPIYWGAFVMLEG